MKLWSIVNFVNFVGFSWISVAQSAQSLQFLFHNVQLTRSNSLVICSDLDCHHTLLKELQERASANLPGHSMSQPVLNPMVKQTQWKLEGVQHQSSTLFPWYQALLWFQVMLACWLSFQVAWSQMCTANPVLAMLETCAPCAHLYQTTRSERRSCPSFCLIRLKTSSFSIDSIAEKTSKTKNIKKLSAAAGPKRLKKLSRPRFCLHFHRRDGRRTNCQQPLGLSRPQSPLLC